MKLVEVIANGSYILGIIQGLENISIFYYWQDAENRYPDHKNALK